MYLTGRQAADVLARIGLCRRQARRVLAAGLAGDPLVTSAADLYREDRVRGLLDWPEVTMAQLDAACPALLFLARRHVDLRAARSEQLAAASESWHIGLAVSAIIRVAVDRDGYVPFLATVGGFIALGANITDVVGSGSKVKRHLVLDEPGEWFEVLRGHRLASNPGRDFLLHGWPPPEEHA